MAVHMAIGIFVLAESPSLTAAPSLRLSDGVTTVLVSDNAPGDFDAGEGRVVFIDTTGIFGPAWTISVAAGVTKPASGSPVAPYMTFQPSVTSSGPASLTIEFSENNFGPVNGEVGVSVSGNIAAGGVLTHSTFVSSSNTLFAGNPLAPPSTLSGPGASANNTAGNVNLPANFALTQRVVITHTAPGTSNANCALSYTPPTGSIGDFVWNDLNGNGEQDGGETGIAGVLVELRDSIGLVNTAVTTTTGFYQFNNLPGGTYSVTVRTDAAAYLPGANPLQGFNASPTGQGGDSAGDSNTNPATNLLLEAANGFSDQSIDFGFYQATPTPPSGQIGNFVWDDANQNGIQDGGELGIPNATVILRDSASGVQIGSPATTDANGKYLFTGLSAGIYKVEVLALTNYVPTFQLQGNDVEKDSNLNPDLDVKLESNDSINLSVDFGFILAVSTIGDRIWADLNGDGIQDPLEPGIPNITVQISGSNGYTASAVTDLDGYYFFPGLKAGTYIIAVQDSALLANYERTTEGEGTPDKDSNPHPTTVVLPANTSNLDVDFGYTPRPTGKIGDFVWRDVNHNGVQDSGETGINNVKVTLKNSVGIEIDSVITSGNGSYLFDGLSAGRYYVQVDGNDSDLTGLIPTVPNAGSNPLKDSNVSGVAVDLGSDSAEDRSIDFGFFAPGCGCIGNYVWKDLDCDGVQDCNEPGIKGVTVKLYWNNILVGSEVTDSCGRYLFCGLWAGTYSVVIDGNQSTLMGLTPTKVGGTTNKANDSSTSPVSVTLATNRTCDMTIDLGFKKSQATGPITTCSLGSWWNKYNPFCLKLESSFVHMYPGGFNVGTGRCLKFTSYQAIKNFLPCNGTPNCIRQTYINPSTQFGSLAGNVVCLRLAVDCSKSGVTAPGLANCKVKYGKFAGWSVGQVLSLAESCLSGSRLPKGCSYKDLSDVCALINENFDCGTNRGNLIP